MAVVIVVALTVLLAGAEVAFSIPVSTGDQFLFVADELLPNSIPNVATALITLGNAIAPNQDAVDSNVDLNIATICLGCLSVFSNLVVALTFDATTVGLFGDVTGTVADRNGGTHVIDLAISDIVAGSGTWDWTDHHTGALGGTDTRTASGTYAPLTPVPEPSSLLLLGSGLAGLGGVGTTWRLQRRR